MRQDFCAFITKKRRDKCLSQIEVAKKIGLTQAQICNIEKGIYFPSVDTLVKLSELYEVSLDDMLGLKRENIVTVYLGNPVSESNLVSTFDKYYSKLLANIEENGLTSELEQKLIATTFVISRAKELLDVHGKKINKLTDYQDRWNIKPNPKLEKYLAKKEKEFGDYDYSSPGPEPKKKRKK